MLFFFIFVVNQAYSHLYNFRYANHMLQTTCVTGTGDMRQLFSVFNSSTVIESVDIIENQCGRIASVWHDSSFECIRIGLYLPRSEWERNNALFSSSGSMEIREFKIKGGNEYGGMRRMYGSLVDVCDDDEVSFSGKVKVMKSEVRDIDISGGIGSFISSGRMERECIEGCVFENVSRGQKRKREYEGMCWCRECSIEGSSFIGGSMGIYGDITSGLLSSTLFLCTNSTFSRYSTHSTFCPFE